MIKKARKVNIKLAMLKVFGVLIIGITINGTQLTKQDSLLAMILINDERNEKYETPQEFELATKLITVRELISMTVREVKELYVKNLAKTEKIKHKTWTLKADDYLVKGKVENFTTISKLLEDYQEVMKITNVEVNDYGSRDMWNFTITGA